MPPRGITKALARRGNPLVNATITVALSLVFWEFFAFSTGGIGFAHALEVLSALGKVLLSISFWPSFGMTIMMTMVGLGLGVIVAIVVGLPLGASRFVEQSSRGTLNFARSIPSIALLPLLMASLGSSLGIVLVLTTVLVGLKMVIFVIRGLRDVDKAALDYAAVMHLSPVARTLFVLLPSASAIIVTGVRLSVNRAYGAVILAGFFGGTPGLGRDITLSRINGDPAVVLAYVVIAALLGVFFFWGFARLERSFVSWRAVA